MADVITRFKLETTQYDSALRNAAQQLNEYGSRAMAAGREFQKFTKGQAEVAREFGNIAVAAKNPKDKVKELVAAFNEAAKAYNALTKEQQQSDWGKGLAESLQTLKVRISDAKKELYDFGDGVKGGGGLTGALDQLAGKFGLNIQQLAGWGAAIGAAKVALDVAKDAFFASEATVDEWGRVMDSSKSLYEGFLTALNTGDISGYLSRIDEIVSAARTAYNELDRLGTMKTIQAPQKSAQQTENDRIRQMIQTGHYIAPLDGRKPAPGMKDGQLLTPEQIRTLERQLQNGMKTVVGLVGNEVKQTGKAIDAVYERQAKELGMSLSEFRKGTSSMAEFDKRMKDYQRYLDYENEHSTLIRTSYGTRTVRDNTANPYEGAQKWATFRVDGDRYNELVQLILQRDQQAAQAYGMQSQAYRAINRAEGITTRSLLGGGSGGGKTGGGGSVTPLNIKLPKKSYVQDFSSDNMLANNWMESLASVNSGMFAELKAKQVANINRFAEVNDIPLAFQLDESATQQQIKDALDNINLFMGENPIQLNFATGEIESAGKIAEDGKKADETWKDAASAVQSVGQAFNQIEDPAAKVAGTIAQAVATVALSYAQTLGKTKGPWEWIAFAATGLAQMIATISTIKNVAHFAEGGIVGGNDYTDNTPIMVSSGELILNRAQQGNLASQLQEGNAGRAAGLPFVNGQNIFLGTNNYLKGSGQGQLVTTQMLRSKGINI